MARTNYTNKLNKIKVPETISTFVAFAAASTPAQSAEGLWVAAMAAAMSNWHFQGYKSAWP